MSSFHRGSDGRTTAEGAVPSESVLLETLSQNSSQQLLPVSYLPELGDRTLCWLNVGRDKYVQRSFLLDQQN